MILGADPLTKLQRWYIRCAGCLSVAAVDVTGRPDKAECSLCGGPIELMGRVSPAAPWKRASLVEDHLRAACDDRCQAARGPSCDCQCGGENHGVIVLVRIEVAAGNGVLPRVCILDTPKARARLAEWTAALADFEAAFAPFRAVYDAKRRGEYVQNFGAYMDARGWRAELADARSKRTHEARMRNIRSTIDRMRAGRSAGD